MAKAPFGDVLDYLRSLYPAENAGGQTDSELLQRFVAGHDEASFRVLVGRHGPMVLGVCQRLLGDRHLAEDSFQATFIILARRAEAIRSRSSLGTWLYSVAQRVALKAKAKMSAQRTRERESAAMRSAQHLDESTWQELRTIIDEEIARLPEKYQAPLVLCHLEGKSHGRAAQELGCAKTTLERRLSRARELLRQQLVRRGVSLSAAVLATALSDKVLAAPVTLLLVKNTVQAAVHILAGKGVVGGLFTGRALVLAEEALVGMASAKGKLMVMVVVMGLGVGGAGWAGYYAMEDKAQPAKAEHILATAAQEAPAQPKENEAEKIFHAMEKKMLTAKTLKIIYEVEAADEKGAVGVRSKGLSQLADGNKARFESDGTLAGKGFKVLLVSDGKQTVMRSTDQPKLLPVATPARFHHDAVTVFVRMGGFMATLWFNPADPADREDINKKLSVSDVTLGGKERIGTRDAQIVEFTIELEKTRVKLWIDPKTMLPLKRRIVAGDSLVTELYTDVVLDAQLDAKLFQLPPPARPEATPAEKDASSGQTNLSARLDMHGDSLPPGAVARLGTVRFRQANPIALAFLSDGKVLASPGGNVFAMSFWDVPTGRLLHRLEQFGGILAFAPDGKTVFTAYAELFDLATGQQLRQFRPRANYRTVAFAPDGKTVAAGESIEGTKIIVWDVAAGKELIRLVGHDKFATSIALAPDSKTLASASDDKTVRLWDVASGKELRRFDDGQGYVGQVAFAPSGKILAASDENGIVHLWDAATGKALHRLKADDESTRIIATFPTDAHVTMAFDPDGKLLATAGQSGTICLWQPENGKEVRRWQAHSGQVASLAFAPKGKMLASAGTLDNAMRLWDTAMGKPINPMAGHTGEINMLHYSANANSLWSAGQERKVLEWDMGTGRERRVLFDALSGPPQASTWKPLDLSSDGKLMALGESKKDASIIHLWDTVSGKELRVLRGHPGTETTIRVYLEGKFSPDGTLFASLGSWPDGMRLWEVATAKQRHHLEGVSRMTFSGDGKFMALSGMGQPIRLWEVATAKELRSWQSELQNIQALAVSPDGEAVAAAGNRGVRAWGHSHWQGNRQPRPQRLRPTEHILAAVVGVFAEWPHPRGRRIGKGLPERANGKCEHDLLVGCVFQPESRPNPWATGDGEGDGFRSRWQVIGIRR